MLSELSTELANSLIDIVNKIEIVEDYSFRHQDYQPLIIAPEMVTKIQKLPLNFQEQYFALQLRNYLANVYFYGYCRQINSKVSEISLPLENNTIKGVNRDFYEQLETNNHSYGYFDPGWVVIREDDDGSLAVQKNELTFQIRRDRHLKSSDIEASINDIVAIKLPHNRLQNEYYVAISNQGLINYTEINQEQIIEIYFNINPEGAIILMRELTQQLNELEVKFIFKLFDNPNDYPGYGAGVLAFFSNDYSIVETVIKSIFPLIESHLNLETPLCTFKLARGISLAEVTQEGFVNSRCGAIANGLLAAWYERDNSPKNRFKYIEEEFSLADINIQYPYLNGNFERIYYRLF